MSRNIVFKSKTAPKDFAPKAILAQPETVQVLPLGTLTGIASGVVQRTMPTGEVYEGLEGTFRATPADETKDVIQSGICYLPPGIYETIREPLMQTDANGKRIVQSIQFAFNVTARRAQNPAGYEWGYSPILDAEAGDPLAALEAKVKEKLALPAPEPAKAARK